MSCRRQKHQFRRERKRIPDEKDQGGIVDSFYDIIVECAVSFVLETKSLSRLLRRRACSVLVTTGPPVAENRPGSIRDLLSRARPLSSPTWRPTHRENVERNRHARGLSCFMQMRDYGGERRFSQFRAFRFVCTSRDVAISLGRVSSQRAE